MLSALETFSYKDSMVNVPRSYLFDRTANIQVLGDISSTIDLKTALVSPNTSTILSKSMAMSIGFALGTWLRDYHSWASSPSRMNLLAGSSNTSMRKLKYQISYGCIITVLEQFPDILCNNKKPLQDVQDMAIKEFEINAIDVQGSEWGIIHGDFWSGKYEMISSQYPIDDS